MVFPPSLVCERLDAVHDLIEDRKNRVDVDVLEILVGLLERREVVRDGRKDVVVAEVLQGQRASLVAGEAQAFDDHVEGHVVGDVGLGGGILDGTEVDVGFVEGLDELSHPIAGSGLGDDVDRPSEASFASGAPNQRRADGTERGGHLYAFDLDGQTREDERRGVAQGEADGGDLLVCVGRQRDLEDLVAGGSHLGVQARIGRIDLLESCTRLEFDGRGTIDFGGGARRSGEGVGRHCRFQLGMRDEVLDREAIDDGPDRAHDVQADDGVALTIQARGIGTPVIHLGFRQRLQAFDAEEDAPARSRSRKGCPTSHPWQESSCRGSGGRDRYRPRCPPSWRWTDRDLAPAPRWQR